MCYRFLQQQQQQLGVIIARDHYTSRLTDYTALRLQLLTSQSAVQRGYQQRWTELGFTRGLGCVHHQGPNLQDILRFTIRLSEVYCKMDLR